MAYTNTKYTYGEAIREICRMVGHPVPIDAAGSTDRAVQQMGVSINRALDELLTMFDWEELTFKTTLSVVGDSAGQTEKGFDLPDDFYKFIDQTQWGLENQLPAAGPVTPQIWMNLVIRSTSPQMTLAWQRRGGQIFFLAPPYPTPVTFEYMYLSKGIVYEADTPTDTKNAASKNGDTFVIDDMLVLLLGRAKYLEWKGFDSAVAKNDFLLAFNSRTGANKGAAVLDIGRGGSGMPLINAASNIPDTGYGS